MAEGIHRLVRMISTRFLTAWLVGMFVMVSAQTPPVQVGDMSCILNTTTGIMKAKMAIYKKTAPVSRTYFTQLDAYHIEYKDTGCQWTGTGTDTDPFLAEVEIDSQTNLPPFGQNGCGYQIIDPVEQVYKWTAYNQRQDEHGREGDAVFVFECSGKGTPTSISVQVTFDARDNEGVAQRIRPENRLSILEQPAGSSSFVQVVTDDISVQQLIKLRIETKVKTTRQIGIDHYGVYGFYCDWRHDASGPSTRFIEMNGCGNSVFNRLLGTGFMYSRFQTVSPTERWFQTETNSFIFVPSVPANNYFYIQCFVGYCYGTEGVDSRCNDYCGTNARSRRSLSNVTEFDSVSIKVKVKNDQQSETVNVEQTVEEETIVEKQTGLASQTIIIIVASVLGILLSALILAVAVVCCCRKRRHNADKEWSDMSTTDSRKNLSSYVSAFQHRYPKY